MTSIDLLAEGAAPAGSAFEADFYVATAAVIPVLFLALIVQGPAYRKALQATWFTCLGMFRNLPSSETVSIRFLRRPPDRFIRAAWTTMTAAARLILAFALGLVLTFGIAIVAAGGYGEILAVYALYQAHDQHSTRLIVLLATMLLIILIITGPLVTYVMNAFNPELDSQEPQPPGMDQPKPAQQTQPRNREHHEQGQDEPCCPCRRTSCGNQPPWGPSWQV